MRPEVAAIESALRRRFDLDAIYLCGPFDSRGEPASADIHVLALSRDDEVIDLHYLPHLSGFDRRIEVSVVPATAVRAAIEKGVKTWLMFYTLDKMRRGKPIAEPPPLAELRTRIGRGLKLRPSFQAGITRNIISVARGSAGAPFPVGSEAWRSRPSGSGPILSLLGASTLLLLSLSACSIIKLKETYSRHSELWLQVRHRVPGRLEPYIAGNAENTLRSAERFLRAVLSKYGIRPGAMRAYHLGRTPEGGCL